MDELAKRIFNLKCFDLYDAYDNSEAGTPAQVVQGIKNSIKDDPQGVIEWLITNIEELEN